MNKISYLQACNPSEDWKGFVVLLLLYCHKQDGKPGGMLCDGTVQCRHYCTGQGGCLVDM